MSTADLLGTSPDRPADPPRAAGHAAGERARLLRTAGWASVLVFLVWLCQPILVGVLAASGTDDSPDLAALEAMQWVGGIEAVLFTGIGVAAVTAVLATWRLVRSTGEGAGTGAQVGAVIALVGATAWFWVAGHSLSMYTSIGAGLAEVSADSEIQSASLQATYLAVTAGLLVVSIGSSGWFLLLAGPGHRAGLVGTPFRVVLVALAAVPLAQVAVPFSAPWPLMVAVLGSLVVGVALLLASRKAGRGADSVPSSAHGG